MAAEYPPPIYLDTTVVSNFATTDSIAFLAATLEEPVVVPAVRDELERGLDAGHGYLGVAVDAIGTDLELETELPAEDKVRERLDPGEAETLLAATANEGTMATDDLAARTVAEEPSVPVTGSVGILVLGVERGTIDSDTADRWLEEWRDERGYFAPIDSVTELLDE